MKANEAPEKIYLQQYDENTLICLNKWNISEEWTNKPCIEKTATNIEYTRTDIVLDWIKNKAENYIVDTPLCSYFDYKRAVEDFKNYMKGK